MKGQLFYNLPQLGDILFINLDSDLLPSRSETKGDVTLIYSLDKLVGINIFNFSKICKIKSNGRIVLPPDSLIDIINNILDPFKIEKLDYVKESGFKIGQILEVEEHPESSHLHLLKVDVGDEVLDIVCGAYNVKKGLKVVVATLGASMMDGSVIVLNKLLGEESYGMCCSAKELGIINDDPPHHLLEIEENIPLGTDFFKLV